MQMNGRHYAGLRVFRVLLLLLLAPLTVEGAPDSVQLSSEDGPSDTGRRSLQQWWFFPTISPPPVAPPPPPPAVTSFAAPDGLEDFAYLALPVTGPLPLRLWLKSMVDSSGSLANTGSVPWCACDHGSQPSANWPAQFCTLHPLSLSFPSLTSPALIMHWPTPNLQVKLTQWDPLLHGV